VGVEAGAVVKDSILFPDCVIKKDAVVDYAILDKRVQVGEGSHIGKGDKAAIENKQYPKHLFTGISLLGKEAEVPDSVSVGRNCIVSPYTKAADFQSGNVESGETVGSE